MGLMVRHIGSDGEWIWALVHRHGEYAWELRVSGFGAARGQRENLWEGEMVWEIRPWVHAAALWSYGEMIWEPRALGSAGDRDPQ